MLQGRASGVVWTDGNLCKSGVYFAGQENHQHFMNSLSMAGPWSKKRFRNSFPEEPQRGFYQTRDTALLIIPCGTHRWLGHTGGLATGIWSPVPPPASCLQAVLWRWAPLGWLHDHCAAWAAAPLCCAGFLLPSAQSPETRWQRRNHQKCGTWKLHKDRHFLFI